MGLSTRTKQGLLGKRGRRGTNGLHFKSKHKEEDKRKNLVDQNTLAFLSPSVTCKPGLALVLVCSCFPMRTRSLLRAKGLIGESLNISRVRPNNGMPFQKH